MRAPVRRARGSSGLAALSRSDRKGWGGAEHKDTNIRKRTTKRQGPENIRIRTDKRCPAEEAGVWFARGCARSPKPFRYVNARERGRRLECVTELRKPQNENINRHSTPYHTNLSRGEAGGGLVWRRAGYRPSNYHP